MSAVSAVAVPIHRASGNDVRISGCVAVDAHTEQWSGTVSLAIEATGLNGRWGAARGELTWESQPAMPQFPFQRLTASVKCLTSRWTIFGAQEFRRVVVTAMARNAPPPFAGRTVVFELDEVNGQMSFSLAPQFEGWLAAGAGTGLAHATRGALEVTVPASPALVTPFGGITGTTLTISDAGGRFRAGDLAYFVPAGANLSAGVVATDVVVSPDRRFLRARVPPLPLGGYRIIVAGRAGDPTCVPEAVLLENEVSFVSTAEAPGMVLDPSG